jgi:hypothetical protein
MLVMAVLLLAGTTFMTISSTESRIALNEQVSTQAMSLAEAGLHRAMANLNVSPSYSGETNVSLGTGTFTVTVSTPASQSCPSSTARDVVVTGSVPIRGSSAKAQIAATVDKIGTPFRYGAFATVPNTIVAGDYRTIFGNDRTESELWVDENSRVDSYDSTYGAYTPSPSTTNRTSAARIGGNGDVTIAPGVQVSGSVRAGDAIHKDASATVSGTQTTDLGAASNSPGDQFPLITPPVTPSSELSLYQANWIISPGTYYWTSLTIPANSSLVPASNGVVTIYITPNPSLPYSLSNSGNVSIGDNVQLGNHPNTNMRIIMKSDASLTSTAAADMTSFSAGNNFTFYGGLYGRNANVSIGENSRVYGSVIGRTTWLQEGTQLHYDQAMMASQVCGAVKYAVRPGSWREVIP